MFKLTNDSNLQIADLARFVDPVEIYDANGKLIGLFVPANLERGKEMYARLSANLDRAEIARRKAEEKPGRTAQEILQSLREADQRAREQASSTPGDTSVLEKTECVTP